MKIQTLVLMGIISTTTMAQDFLHPSYRVKPGQFLGNSSASVSNMQQDGRDTKTNLVNKNKVSSQLLEQHMQYGLTKNLSMLTNLTYATAQTQERENSQLKSQGLERFEMGASYRLNGKMKLPVFLDLGLIAKISTEDKRLATANDEGSAGSGAHELIVTTRASRNRYFADMAINHSLASKEVNATTGLVQAQTRAHTDIILAAGKQFVPTQKLLLNSAAKFIRVGEHTTVLEGGEIKVSSHMRYGVNLLAQYVFNSRLSASLGGEYLLSSDHEIDSFRTQKVENESATELTIGVSYIF